MLKKYLLCALVSMVPLIELRGGMLMATSALTLYLAYQCMDAGLASTVLFVYPVIVAVVMSCFYGEKLS